MQAEEKKALIFELADTVFQSWWTIVAGVCFGLTGALLALGSVQPWYDATALVYVTPELTRELARSTVSEDMTRRMLALQEAVLGPEYLRRMIETTYGPVENEERAQAMMRGVRSRVIVEAAAVGSGGESLFAFNLKFRDTTAERASEGANLLAELYIEQNKEFRTSQAREVLRAAEEQASRARSEFDAIDRELSAFRGEHRFETGEHQSANISQFERSTDALDNNLADQRNVENRIQDLQRQLAAARVGAASTAEEIAGLRQELDALLVQYSEAHPSVKSVRRRLRDAMKELGVPAGQLEQAPSKPEEYPPDPRVTAIETDIKSAERQLAQIKTRETKIRGEIAEYERRIEAVPSVQPQLSRLDSEHRMLRERYEEAQARVDRNREALYLEETLSAERFELAERAEPPGAPVYPKPFRFYLMGIVAGCMFFVGPPLARRFLSPIVSSEAGLRALTDVPVLVTIPRIVTSATRGLVMRRRVKNFALSTLCATMAATAFFLVGVRMTPSGADGVH